jgi:hypothetical protein
MLRFTHFKNTLADHGTSINRLETALGTVRQNLGLPAPATCNCKQEADKGVSVTDKTEVIK